MATFSNLILKFIREDSSVLPATSDDPYVNAIRAMVVDQDLTRAADYLDPLLDAENPDVRHLIAMAEILQHSGEPAAAAGVVLKMIQCLRVPLTQAINDRMATSDEASADDFYLGGLSLFTCGDSKKTALTLIERAAALKHPAAMQFIGCVLIAGNYCEPDPKRGRKLIREAAKLGFPPAILSRAERKRAKGKDATALYLRVPDRWEAKARLADAGVEGFTKADAVRAWLARDVDMTDIMTF